MSGPSLGIRRVAITQHRHAVAHHQTQTRAVWAEDGARRRVEAHARVFAHLADIMWSVGLAVNEWGQRSSVIIFSNIFVEQDHTYARGRYK